MKTFTKNQFNAIVISASVILSVTFFQSCTKDNAGSEAPSANISNANGSFPGVPTNIVDSISTGLIAYWPLASNVYDFSGNGNKGIRYNLSDAFDRMNNNTGAFYFSGNKSYVAVRDTGALRLANTDFTINAWVSAFSFSSTMGVLTKRLPGAGNGWSLNLTAFGDTPSEGFVFAQGGLKTAAGNGLNWVSGNWHMVTTTYSVATQKMRIYVDGSLQKLITGISSPNAANNARLYIGSGDPNLQGSAASFTGSLSDIRLYSRAISSNEVQYLYNVPPAPTQDLNIYSTFTATANDLSSGHSYTSSRFHLKQATDRFGNPHGANAFGGTANPGYASTSSPIRLDTADFTLNTWVYFSTYDNPRDSILPLLWSTHTGNAADSSSLLAVGGIGSGFKGRVFYNPVGVNDAGAVTGTKSLSLNKWHMITAVYTKAGGNLKIYVDNILDVSTGGVAPPPVILGDILYFGYYVPVSGSPLYLNGNLNDVRVYGRAISTAEITQLYRALN